MGAITYHNEKGAADLGSAKHEPDKLVNLEGSSLTPNGCKVYTPIRELQGCIQAHSIKDLTRCTYVRRERPGVSFLFPLRVRTSQASCLGGFIYTKRGGALMCTSHSQRQHTLSRTHTPTKQSQSQSSRPTHAHTGSGFTNPSPK